MAFCPNCGANVPDGAAQCQQCGAAMNAAQQPQQNTVPQGNPYQQNTVPQGNPYQQQVPPQGAPYQPVPGQVPPGYEPKSKMAAGLLGIFLGSFGVHNFYLGYTGKAVAQLLMGTVGWITCGIAPAAAGIWGLIEGIMILTGSIKVDGKNVPLKD